MLETKVAGPKFDSTNSRVKFAKQRWKIKLVNDHWSEMDAL